MAAERARIIGAASAKAGEFSGATGYSCRQWGQKFLHVCESFGLTPAVRLQTFAACMEGEALRWFSSLDDETKGDLEALLEELYVQFSATGPAFQAELEREYKKIQQAKRQSVNEYGRNFQLVVGLMEEPPSQTKQLIHFKRGLQDCIKSKMEIRQYANIADMIQQAQLVEEDCLNEHQGEFNAGLTRGMFRQSSNNPIPLGIHDADENREVLTANNLSKQDQGGAKDEFLQQILSAIKSMQTTISSMASSNTQTAPKETQNFPYPDRGQSFNPSIQGGRFAKKQRRVERIQQRMTNSNTETREDDFQRKRRSGESSDSTPSQYCPFHNSSTHAESECRAIKRMKALQGQTQESLSFNSLQQSSSMEKGEEKEFSSTPAILIGTTNSQGEGIVVVGDSGASVCLIQESEVFRNGLKVLRRNEESITKGIGKNGIIMCKGDSGVPYLRRRSRDHNNRKGLQRR